VIVKIYEKGFNSWPLFGLSLSHSPVDYSNEYGMKLK
jgi:hypothetical protein